MITLIIGLITGGAKIVFILCLIWLFANLKSILWRKDDTNWKMCLCMYGLLISSLVCATTRLMGNILPIGTNMSNSIHMTSDMLPLIGGIFEDFA